MGQRWFSMGVKRSLRASDEPYVPLSEAGKRAECHCDSCQCEDPADCKCNCGTNWPPRSALDSGGK